jgi:hypothetical protein
VKHAKHFSINPLIYLRFDRTERQKFHLEENSVSDAGWEIRPSNNESRVCFKRKCGRYQSRHGHERLNRHARSRTALPPQPLVLAQTDAAIWVGGAYESSFIFPDSMSRHTSTSKRDPSCFA